MKKIAIKDEADQQFAIVSAERRLVLRIRHNVRLDRMTMDVALGDEWLLYGRRIVTGVNLLAPFALGAGAIFAWRDNPSDEPTRANLVSGRVELFYLP